MIIEMNILISYSSGYVAFAYSMAHHFFTQALKKTKTVISSINIWHIEFMAYHSEHLRYSLRKMPF